MKVYNVTVSRRAISVEFATWPSPTEYGPCVPISKVTVYKLGQTLQTRRHFVPEHKEGRPSARRAHLGPPRSCSYVGISSRTSMARRAFDLIPSRVFTPPSSDPYPASLSTRKRLFTPSLSLTSNSSFFKVGG